MARVYRDNPGNISEILPYVITDESTIAQNIIMAQKCYFYDASSFRKHSTWTELKYIAMYIRKNHGVVIITRTILMEICSAKGEIWDEHIVFFKKMYELGIKIILMYEENVFNAMYFCYSATEINQCLKYAVRTCKSKLGAVEKIVSQNKFLEKEVLSQEPTMGKSLVKRFFSEMRRNKSALDNMGEELITICMHMLSNIPELIQYKYIMFTEDKGAVLLLGKATKNIYDILKKRMMAAITTPKLLQEMIENELVNDISIVCGLLEAEHNSDYIRIFCCEEYDLEPDSKVMTCNELAEKLLEKNKIHIFY